MPKKVPLQVKTPTSVKDAEAFVAGDKDETRSKNGEEQVRLTVYVSRGMVRRLKVLAIDKRMSASALVREALQRLLGDTTTG